MNRTLYLLLLSSTATFVFAQKTVHIPNYLQNPNDVNGAQFTWSKTAQSENFILIWGNTVGTNPANYPDPNLAFNPSKILDTMEYIYDEFKLLGFLDDSPGTNLAQYKVPIVIYGTWGPNGAQGFANGGDADGIIGAFWAHPSAMLDGGVAAHEFTHSLQAQNTIDYRNDHGLGPSWLNSGIFWECHANFMRNLLYPQFVTAWGMDVYHYEAWGDWKNTYENYALLMAILESEGIEMVNRLWRESLGNEYPLQAYKRLAGYSQSQFNDSLYQYARRMATYDYNYKNLGQHFRQKRNADLNNWLPTIQNVYSILRPVTGGVSGRYEIPIEQAPEEYAYNVIPLYPNADSCAVIIKFKGHTEVNTHAGWRYGFVAAKANGTVSRYSPAYSANTGEIHFKLQSGETRLYLVVMGAPRNQITTNPNNDTWKGYPKHFRFPYELTISGAVPEGHQPPAGFRAQLKVNGHIHPNGGGWVQNSASVASSVYVGPTAIVLGNSNISGQVRIEGTALVRNTTMSGNVQILGNAFVDKGMYSNNAKIQGNAFVIDAAMSGNAVVGMRARVDNYTLSGTVEVGGDVVVYNDAGNCNNGVHYRLTNYYDNKFLECDGRTAGHPANSDVNSAYSLFPDSEMALSCSCGGTTFVTVDSVQIGQPDCTNPASGSVQFFISTGCPPLNYAWSKGAETGSSLTNLLPGDYSFTITDGLGKTGIVAVQIPVPPALSGSLSSQPYDCSSDQGGTAGIDLNSGTAPFSYLWSTGATSASLQGLTPGNYSLTVTDALGCTFTGSADIGLSGQLSADVLAMPIDCGSTGGGVVEATLASGTAPFSYLWSTGETTASIQDLPTGNYSLTVTDALGCTALGAAEVVRTGTLGTSISATHVSCFGLADGSMAVEPTGGTAPFSYLWSTGETSPTLQNLPAGNYDLTVTDALGCEGIVEFSLTEPAVLALQITTTHVTCFGAANGMVGITATGGTQEYDYAWSNQITTADISDLAPGSYTVTVTDANNCTATTEATIVSPLLLELTIQAPANLCPLQSGTAEAIASGGTIPYDYLWENAATTAAIPIAGQGMHAVTITDANGCSTNASIVVSPGDELELDLVQNVILCHGDNDGTATVTPLTGTAPWTWAWNHGATDSLLTNLGSGNYTVTVSDANGCIGQLTFSLEAPPPLELALNAPEWLCPGDSGAITATAFGGTAPYTYLWNTGVTDSIVTGGAGSYSLTVTDSNGCNQFQTVDLQETPPLSVQFDTLHAGSATTADGGIILTDISGGLPPYTYSWSNGASSPSLENILPGEYQLTITDASGCTWLYAFAVSFGVAANEWPDGAFQVWLAPNPSVGSSRLFLDLPQAENIEITIVDVLGRVQVSLKTRLQAGGNKMTLPADLVAGIYWINVKYHAGGIRVLRWVVQ